MASLPDLIEVVPLREPVRAVVAVPGSKSITNRTLILAALGDGETILQGALWSEDTQVMVECLQELGYMITVEQDPAEDCNRTLTVYGRGARVPRGGTPSEPLDLFVANAGTAARFLTAMVCLGEGVYRIHGIPRMHERPQAHLFQALRALGYRVEAPNERLPALVFGGGPRAGRCQVSIGESSQFASALLLSAAAGNWQVEVVGENAEESSYVAMTSRLIEVFPRQGGRFRVEPDASSGSYFWALNLVSPAGTRSRDPTAFPPSGPAIAVAHWPASGWQIDERFANYMAVLNSLATRPAGTPITGEPALPGGTPAGWARGSRAAPVPGSEAKTGAPRIVISRRTDLADSIMTAIAIAPTLSEPVHFTDLGRLRLQECERVVALRTELTRCGAKVVESGDTLTVYPSVLRGTEIETYNDHRMAMSFAILGSTVPGMRIRNPACVKKTFPNFFQKLAAPPPCGPGVAIRDAGTGRDLSAGELFAE